MDAVAELVKALYEGRDADASALGPKERESFLRLQVVAAFAGFRLLLLMERIRDNDFLGILLSTVEDCDPLLEDALRYSQERNAALLSSFFLALEQFCWFKRVEMSAFLALCPRLPERLVGIRAYAEGVKPERRLVYVEESRLEKVYRARLPFR